MEISSPVLSLFPFLQSENSLHHHGLILQAEEKDILHSAQTPNSSDRADPTPSMEPRQSKGPFMIDAGILQAAQASTVLPHSSSVYPPPSFPPTTLDREVLLEDPLDTQLSSRNPRTLSLNTYRTISSCHIIFSWKPEERR